MARNLWLWMTFGTLILLMVLSCVIRPAANVIVNGVMTENSKVELYDPQLTEGGFLIGINELSGLLGKKGTLLLDLPNGIRVDSNGSSVDSTNLCSFLVDEGFALSSENEQEPCSRLIMQPSSFMMRFTLNDTATLAIDPSGAKQLTVGGQASNDGIDRYFVLRSDSEKQREKRESTSIVTLRLDVSSNGHITLIDVPGEDLYFKVVDPSRLILSIQQALHQALHRSASFTTRSSQSAPFAVNLNTTSTIIDSISSGEVLVNGSVFRVITDTMVLDGNPTVKVSQGLLHVKTTSPIKSFTEGESRIKLPIWYDSWSDIIKSLFWLLIGSLGTTAATRIRDSLKPCQSCQKED